MAAVMAGSENTFDLIRVVATELFCENGYRNVGMRSLASRVGIQAGSLYNHIESKQLLLYELISEYEENYLHVLRRAKKLLGSGCARFISELWESVERFVLSNRFSAHLARFELSNLTQRQSDRVATLKRDQLTQIKIMVKHFQVNVSSCYSDRYAFAEEVFELLDCNTVLLLGQGGRSASLVRSQLQKRAFFIFNEAIEQLVSTQVNV